MPPSQIIHSSEYELRLSVLPSRHIFHSRHLSLSVNRLQNRHRCQTLPIKQPVGHFLHAIQRFILHLAMFTGFYFLDLLIAAVKIEAITTEYNNTVIAVLPGLLAGRAKELLARFFWFGLPEFDRLLGQPFNFGICQPLLYRLLLQTP